MGESRIPSSTFSSSVVRVVVSCARVLLFSFFFLLTLEVATRVEHRMKYGAPLLSRYSYDAVLYTVDEYGIRGRPNAIFEKWQLNSSGFRGPELNLQKSPGKLRIACIGASETFGLYEQAGNEWPRQLEYVLQKQGIDAEVLNAALAGMSLPQRLNHFRNRLLQFRPDVTILMLEYTSYAGLTPSIVKKRRQARTVPLPQTHDDVLDGLKSLRLPTALRYSVLPKLPRFLHGLVSDLGLYWKLRLLQQELGNDFRNFREVTLLELGTFQEDLEQFREVAAQNGVRLILVSPAFWMNVNNFLLFYTSWPYVNESWLRQAQTTFTQAANHIALEHDLRFIDLASVLAGREPALMKDMVHYSDEGAAVVGRAIAHSVAVDLNRLQKQAPNL